MGDDTNRREETAGSYWLVNVDAKKCSLCEVCAHFCAPGAIRSEQTGVELAIVFRHRLCDGCRECVQRCPEEAMRLTEMDAPPDLPEETILAAGQLLECSVCGARYAPLSKLQAASHRREDGAELIREECPLCRRTQMVARLIDERREAKGKKAEYRTGKKWSWKPVADGDREGPPCPDTVPRSTGQHTPGSASSGEDTSADA